MKKLSAILVTVTAALLLLAAPAAAAGGTTGTGTFGPAEEPTWVLPLVALFAATCAVIAILGVRRGRRSPKL